MSSKRGFRLLLAAAVVGLLPACGNINDGHPAVPFTVRASVNSSGVQGNQGSASPVLSGNGRYVVFESDADNLVPGDTNVAKDIFRHDLLTGATELVSLGMLGAPANNASFGATVSFDGRWIAFQSLATNLTSVAPVVQQIFARDMDSTVGNGIVMVSEASPGVRGSAASFDPSISSDGRFVAFASLATNFGDTHANGVRNIYRRDLSNSTILHVSANTLGADPTPPPGLPTPFAPHGSHHPSISADGSRIAYVSDCIDLVDIDGNDLPDVFVSTIDVSITTVLASPSVFGGAAFGISIFPSISSDGKFVAYESSALDLIDVDTNFDQWDVFVFDVDNGTVKLASTNASGFQGNFVEESHRPSISSDGRFVAFESQMSILVPDDTNQATDIFIKDMTSGSVVRVSVDTAGNPSGPNLNSFRPSLTPDARGVAFQSEGNFVKDDLNGVSDIYVRSPLR